MKFDQLMQKDIPKIFPKKKILVSIRNGKEQSFIQKNYLPQDIFNEFLKFCKPRVVTVTSLIHLNFILKLKFVDNILLKKKWFKDGKELLFNYFDANEFISELVLTFHFTGCGTEYLRVKNSSLAEIHSALYNLPMPDNFEFLFVDRCVCNNGTCGKPLAVEFVPKCLTFGEIFKKFARGLEDEFRFYQFPTRGVYLNFQRLDELTELYRDGCDRIPYKMNLKLDPNKQYIIFFFARYIYLSAINRQT